MTTKKNTTSPKPKETGAQAHAKVSPSTFKSREICPSYEPDQQASEASERGDKLHALLQKHSYKAFASLEAQSLSELDLMSLEKICGYIRPIATAKGAKCYHEIELNLRSYRIPDCERGTGDLVVVNGDRFDLVDYKMGFIEVDDAETNLQQWLYVLGVFAMFPGVSHGTAHVLQPWRDEVSSGEFTRDDIPKLLLRAMTVAERVQKFRGKEFNVVPDNCIWCDAKATCQAMHELVLKTAMAAKLTVPDLRPGQLVVDDFADKEMSGVVYDLADLIEKWGKAMRSHIAGAAANGLEVPGHDLRWSSGKRSIIDTARAFEIMEQDFELDPEELKTAMSFSLTELNKLLASKMPRGEKEKFVNKVLNALADDGIVVKSASSPYLVRI